MRTREIPAEQWSTFFNQFTLLHQGDHIHVETIDQARSRVDTHVCDLPLACVAFADPHVPPTEGWVEIVAGQAPDARAVHAVPHPAHVWLAEEEDGQALALQLASLDGAVTMIRFEPSPENLPPGFLVS